ncbi:MAG: FtsX-like permease family protein [Anaerolineae bacterium]|nr:FtsX-like permease family protein [Anaerolineae bacterium]
MIPDTLWRVVLRSIWRRPLQSVLFVAGVALGVAMIVAIDLANGSALRAFGFFTESIAGRTTHQITGGPSGLPEDLYRQIRVDLGVRNSAPIVDAYTQAIELDNQPLRLFGVDPFAEAPFRGYLTLGAGSANTDVGDITRFFVEPNTVLMAEPLAKVYNLKQGDTITLRYGTTRHTVTIIGLLRPSDDVTEQGLQDLLITDISTAQEILGLTGKLTAIDLIIPEGAAGDALLNRINAILPKGAVIQAAAARSNAIAQMTGAFTLSLTALSLLALVVGMFLIYNTVTFSVVQRRPMLGTLRALGVTRRQVFGMVLWEAALLSAIGAVIGLGVGIIMGRAAVVLVTQTVSSLYFTVTVRNVDVQLFTLVKGVVIGIAAALLAALIPAYEATTTPPTGALKRSEIERKIRKAIPAVTVAGVVMVLLSLVSLSFSSVEIGFAGLFGIVVGFSLFTPLVALVLMTAVRPILGKIAGVLGLIAPRSIIRSLSRTSVAVAALMVAVSVIVGVSAMVGSFRNNVEDWIANTIRADILISPPSLSANRQTYPIDPALADVVRQTPGVMEVSVARNVDVMRPGDALPVYLTAYDVDISRGHRRFAWSIGGFDDVWKAMGDGAVFVTESFARHRNIPIGPGQSLTLVTDRGDTTLPIVGVMIDYGSDQGIVFMRLPVYRSLYDDQMISTMAAFTEPGAEVSAIINTLRQKFAGQQELYVQSNRELRQSVLLIFDQTFAITTALNLLATVVAFIGILSALMALQLERTRELGTMRANGLTRGQLFRLTLLETGLMGLIAGLMSLPVGTVLAWVLVYIINVRSFGWSLELQLRPEFYTQAFAVALVAALLAGIYPALRMGRIQPADAIRAE